MLALIHPPVFFKIEMGITGTSDSKDTSPHNHFPIIAIIQVQKNFIFSAEIYINSIVIWIKVSYIHLTITKGQPSDLQWARSYNIHTNIIYWSIHHNKTLYHGGIFAYAGMVYYLRATHQRIQKPYYVHKNYFFYPTIPHVHNRHDIC